MIPLALAAAAGAGFIEVDDRRADDTLFDIGNARLGVYGCLSDNVSQCAHRDSYTEHVVDQLGGATVGNKVADMETDTQGANVSTVLDGGVDVFRKDSFGGLPAVGALESPCSEFGGFDGGLWDVNHLSAFQIQGRLTTVEAVTAGARWRQDDKDAVGIGDELESMAPVSGLTARFATAAHA